MKKALVLLLLLALVGAFAFAQSAPSAGSFHAWNRGTFYPYAQVGSDPAVTAWGPQWDNTGIDQEWNFSYDSGADKSGNSYGFTATDEFGGKQLFATNGAAGTTQWFNTYFDVANTVKLEFGIPRNYDYSIGGFAEPYSGWETNNWNMIECNTDALALATLTPTAGFKIGFGMYSGDAPQLFTAQASGGALNATETGLSNNFVVLASYTAPKIATINAWYKAEDQDTSVTVDPFTANSTSGELKALDINATLISVTNYTFELGYVGEFQNSSNPITRFEFGAKGTQSQLSDALDIVYAGDNTVSAFAAELALEYAVSGPYAIGALVGYDNGDGANWFEGGYGGYAGFMINPYFAINFANGSRVRVGVLYASGVSSVTSDSQIAPNFPSTVTQAVIGIPIDYVWSF